MIKSKKFGDCEYRFSEPIHETQTTAAFKFHLCRANGMRKATYLGHQISYETLMPSEADPSMAQWKAIKRELAALDIMSSSHIVAPIEFVKTKNHCYIVTEFANGGSLASLLLMRGQLSGDKRVRKKRLSEWEARCVMRDVLKAVADVYDKDLAVWDLSPENILLTIGSEM